MDKQDRTFYEFLSSPENKRFIVSALLIGVVYFICLRLLFPVPVFFADSYTYVGAAKNSQPVSFRPIGYSRILVFFRLFSSTDLPVIAAQYYSNLFANLSLFFSAVYFIPLKKAYRQILFFLLIVNPFYLFYSNYISPDSFFCAFTVAWFTLLIWMLHKPSGTFLQHS
jgi:hypothetical protein